MKKTLLVTIIAAALAGLIYWQYFASATNADVFVSFKVERGQNLHQIADNLISENLIRSKRAFTMMAGIKQSDTKIRPGRYKLSGGMNLRQILFALANPEQGEIMVTIPEGFTVHEIDKRLANMGLILPGEFETEASLHEGYLFPDTYSVFKFNFDPQDLLEKMRENFLRKITPDMHRAIAEQKRSLSEIIIMASILEKEVRTGEDYPIVAGILWKRLENGWPMQTDATLLYGKATRTIGAAELSQNSPYNTRINKGLPPTPIGNPGLATIRAAIFPQASRYWFYLTDAQGEVHYAASNDEHNENRRKYLDQ